jgi:hypothetical protein
MRQRIDLDALFQDAREQIGLLAGDVPMALPGHCPFVLADLVEERPDIRTLVLRMARAGEG